VQLSFSRSGVKGIDENWDDIRRFNSVLRRLEKRRATRVERVGPLAKSKIAWKAAVLQQALLYRTIELGGGCAKMWNYGNVLCSVLAARALLETIAVTLDFEMKLHEHYKTRNCQALDQLITSHTFATRDAGFLAEAPELAAKNVLTYIDRLERKMPLIRKHYESLSEWCHPIAMAIICIWLAEPRDWIRTFFKAKATGKRPARPRLSGLCDGWSN